MIKDIDYINLFTYFIPVLGIPGKMLSPKVSFGRPMPMLLPAAAIRFAAISGVIDAAEKILPVSRAPDIDFGASRSAPSPPTPIYRKS